MADSQGKARQGSPVKDLERLPLEQRRLKSARSAQGLWTAHRFNTKPILVTGSHRGGTTWVGRMLTLSPRTYYLGEVFHPQDGRLGADLLTHWYEYVTDENSDAFIGPLNKIFSLDFTWPGRNGVRRLLPSRLAVFKHTRRLFGLPRPVMKDPIAAMSVEWLAETFQMDVICLVRHPAAFVASLKRVKWRFDFNNFLDQPRLMEEWLYPFADQLTNPPADAVGEGALLWLCIYHVLTFYVQRHAEWVCWRLKDISADPLLAFELIYAELDLPYTPKIRRHIAEYSSLSNPAEAPPNDPHLIRRSSRAAQARWRALLEPHEVAHIRRVVEPVACKYYSDADW